MTLSLRRYASAILGGIVCCLMTADLVAAILIKTHGMFVYPLDDSYIHLAVARTLAMHHVWGIGPWNFASASSSPAWTLLLAGTDILFGTHVTTAIYLNLLLAFLILFVVNDVLVDFAPKAPLWLRYVAPLLIVLGTPLPSLVLLGMEHVAQALSILLLVSLSVRVLAMDTSVPVTARHRWTLVAVAVFAGAIRYEAVFAIIPIFLLLAVRRRFSLALLVAAGSAVGPVAFSLYSHHLSGFLLPFSVMVKMTQGFGMAHKLHAGVSILLGKRPELPFLGVLALIWIWRRQSKGLWEPTQLFVLLTVAISLIHLPFGPIGWLMRYEAYLECLILTGVILLIANIDWAAIRFGMRTLTRMELVFGGLLVLLGLVSSWNLIRRVATGVREPVDAAVDRFDEHIQMARFVTDGYDHDTIALNDIGAVAFYTHAKLLDMEGLGSVEPLLPKKRGRTFGAEDMRQWADSEGASIAIVQDTPKVRRELTPSSWTLVQVWQQPNNVVFEGDFTTAFYAVRPAEMARLCDKLTHFPLTREDKVIFDVCPKIQVASAASQP